MSFYESAIDTGKGIKTSNNRGSNAVAFLGNPKTIWKYYQTNLDNIRQNKDRALKSIKEVSKGNWQLKLQCGKYAHPLFIDDDNQAYDRAYFSSKDEAIENAQLWVEDAKNRERGVLRAIETAYTKYANANNITFDDSFFDVEDAEKEET